VGDETRTSRQGEAIHALTIRPANLSSLPGAGGDNPPPPPVCGRDGRPNIARTGSRIAQCGNLEDVSWPNQYSECEPRRHDHMQPVLICETRVPQSPRCALGVGAPLP